MKFIRASCQRLDRANAPGCSGKPIETGDAKQKVRFAFLSTANQGAVAILRE